MVLMEENTNMAMDDKYKPVIATVPNTPQNN